jgi:two-component system, chemotaxis family, response regulator Rcp1
MNILLVEDNPADVRLIREALAEGQVPAQLHWLSSGEEALRFLRRGDGHEQAPRPDLVLLDLNLPGLSGLEVLARIKADPLLLPTPVVVLTSSTSTADVMAAYQAHVNAYLRKPADYDEFLALASSIHDYWLTSVVLPTRLPA